MRIPLKARFYPSPINLTKLAERFPDCLGNGGDVLLIRLDGDLQVCVCDFGGVVFWPFLPEVSDSIGEEIQKTSAVADWVEEVDDRLVVETNKSETKVLFNEIWLSGEATPDQVMVISHLFAQSVGLEHLELGVDEALNRFGRYIDRLLTHGRLPLSTRKMLKTIGFALHTRQAVLGRLALFDKPEVTWESENLERLFLDLYECFELDDRQEAISLKLDFLVDNTRLLFDFLSTRKSLRLEWTIVILIAFEIALFIFYDALRS